MNKKTHVYSLIPLILILVIVSACRGDYRQKAVGPVDEVIVVMDSDQWNSETADATRESFGRLIKTMPIPREPIYKLTFKDFKSNSELEQLKGFRNIIVAAPLGDVTNVTQLVSGMLSSDIRERVQQEKSFAIPLQNHWARDQWTMILTSVSD